ncbi:MAG: ROK family protein [Chloroflexi bacterium]|nr:MAG: ROK family protein [Chloroflexota bacterium]
MKSGGSLDQSLPVLALDVGGTKLAGGVLLGNGVLVCRQEKPTQAEEGAEAVGNRLLELARQVLVDFAVSYSGSPAPVAVGLASAGYINSETGSVLFATDNLPGWTGQPLATMLRTAFGLPAAVANDGACFALAEARLGAGQGYRHVLVTTVGTGVGGGIVIDGELYCGWQGRAGAIGHLCIEPVNGRACTCGLYGCLESYTAVRIMVAESGYTSIQELAAHYAAGNEESAVEEAAMWLGRGLASLAHVLGPEAIIIGGSVGLLGERYLEAVQSSFRRHAMPLHHAIAILPAQLAADSGLVGAGLLARESATA